MKSSYTVVFLFIIATCLVVPSLARGGRGRGGGSFGGLFGGWRKYKKPSSSGGGRRVVSGEPMPSSMSIPKPPPPPGPAKPMMAPKPQISSYPRQQLPPGYSYPASSGPGGMGMGGTYYANAQALPAGAVFYAQPPMSMTRGSGTGDFLTGMLAGHMMHSLMLGHRHQGYHRNREDQLPAQSTNGREIIIINNGQPEGGEGQQNETQIPEEVALTPENPLTDEQSSSSSSEEMEVTPEPRNTADGGIVCFPIMVNETEAENPEVVRQVERVVCFPAPANLSEDSFMEQSSTTSTEPPIVAGDIGGADKSGDQSPIEVASYVTTASRADHMEDEVFQA